MTGLANDLRAALEAAGRVRDRLDRAVARVAPLFPMDAVSLDQLDPDRRMEVDLLLKPWETLYELIARRVFSALIAAEGEDVREMTMRDRLAFLEKIGVLDTGEDWMALRDLRNRLAHEYPLRPDYQARLFNQAWETVAILTRALDACTDYAHRRNLVGRGVQGE